MTNREYRRSPSRLRVSISLVAVFTVMLARPAGAPQKDPQRPTFRTSTELAVIDVQAVARDGAPIAGLRADQFEVHIDGRRRPVVSAEFVTSGSLGTATRQPTTVPPNEAIRGNGRTIMLAIDEASFPMSARASAREAATRLVDRVSTDDYLGLMAFPGRVDVPPTRDRRAVRDAIDRISGVRIEPPPSRFNVSAAEAVKIRSRASVATREIIDRECGRTVPPDPLCRQEVAEVASWIANALEQQAMLTIHGLHWVLDKLTEVPDRKTLVVVTAGLPMSNLPGGQPNFDAETRRVALRAAAANISLYVFYLNVHFLKYFSPEYGRQNHSIFEDVTMFGYGLEKFADTAGGAFFQIEVDADPFVDRALRETSAVYLVAVPVEPADRDGSEHFVRVAVKQRGVTIRYRRVLTIPKERPTESGRR